MRSSVIRTADRQPSALHALALAGLVAAGALAAWTAGRLFWAVVAAGGDAATERAGPVTGRSSSLAAADPVDLTRLHLFGQAGAAPGGSRARAAPETQLALTLLGTAAADDPAAGLAIVAGSDGEQGYFRAGDDLPGGATLREIHADRVVLERQGRLETLPLDRDRSTASRRVPPAAGGGAGGRTPGTSGTGQLDWSAARNAARVDPARLRELGKQIRALPFTENGKPIGVRLVASRDAAMLNRLGLRSSDIITAVNGIPLSDPTRQFELMNLLNNQSQFQVRLRRNGSDMTVNVDARKLESSGR